MTLSLRAGEDLDTGQVVTIAPDGQTVWLWCPVAEEFGDRLAGVARRNIASGELIRYDPLRDTEDIAIKSEGGTLE